MLTTPSSPVAFMAPNLRAVAFKMQAVEGRKFFVKKPCMVRFRISILSRSQPLACAPCNSQDIVNAADQLDRIEFKAIPAHYMPQVVRRYFGQPLHLEDLAFTFDGLRAQRVAWMLRIG